MEEAPGVPLHISTGSARTAGHRSAGLALARFHACRIPGLEPYGVGDELHLLRCWLSFAADLRPDLVALLAFKIDHLARDARLCASFEPVPIHRDFHDKQVIVSDSRTTLIDFDTVRSGDPAQDLGNFLAHLHLDVVNDPIEPERTTEWQAFIEGYQSVANLPPAASIDWHRRATLLRLALINGFSDTLGRLAVPLARNA
jgi:Ser/Thr protein kinase RdoA (MazF antagonist)